ncbi:hypothetical protein [Lutibacter sp.]|nr:hypothetical protein [Lutibacter sp.]MBI9041812.1 hypothetical protein [Lutibacter sp.]
MRTKNTFSTNYWLQSSRAINDEELLYVRITINKKRLSIRRTELKNK